jgi:sulfatase maturation enzyme AslB (radical SAM superfamily)
MFKQYRACACEMFSSAICNLDCAYCYIPKTTEMKNIHQNIIHSLKTGSFLENAKKLYDNRLEHLSLWGAEPTMILKELSKVLPQFFDAFPRLKSLSFSTNFVKNIDIMLDFIEKMPKDRSLEFKIQVSLDGPKEITDVNRGTGATEAIEKNINYFYKQLNEIDLGKIKFYSNLKPTWDGDNISLFYNDLTVLHRTVKYLKNFYKFLPPISNKNISVHYVACGTLALPGIYTVDDGRKWARICRELNKLDKEDGNKMCNSYLVYKMRIDRMLVLSKEYFNKFSMFTCSGGDSNWMLDDDGNIHICHRTAFSAKDKYIEEALKVDKKNRDIDYFKNGTLNLIKKNYIVNIDDQYEIDRLSYTMGGYHNFFKLKDSFNTAILTEMVLAGQANKCYLNKEFAGLFTMFMNNSFSCPAEALLTNGSTHLIPVSIIRLFANGAFEEIFKACLEEL